MEKKRISFFKITGLILVIILLVNCKSKIQYYEKKIDFLRYQNLLLSKKFDQLNKELDDLQKQFETDFKTEFRLSDAYSVFGLTSPELELIFNEWVEKYPDLYQPYIARAEYFKMLGWNYRGYKFSNETTGEQFMKMNICFKKSLQDVEKAIELNNKCFIPYLILIDIKGGSNINLKINPIVEGLKINPYSILLRYRHLWFLQPIWGGSIHEMETFIKSSESFYDKNPALRVLKGFPYMSKGTGFRHSGNYNEAIKLHKKAISFGGYHIFFKELAWDYVKLKKYKEALKAINSAIELHPHYRKFYQLRSMIHLDMGNFANGKKDIEMYNKLFPYRVETDEYNQWASSYFTSEASKLFNSSDLETGLKFINTAIELDENNNKALYLRGFYYFKKRKYDLAMKDLKKSIKIDPKFFYPYKTIDNILIRKKKYDEIIGYWSQYIELVPDDAKAYLERSGTYYHKGDYKSSLRDAKKAAELNKEYQIYYEKIKKRIG